jgi:predicted nucleic acid-binding protein
VSRIFVDAGAFIALLSKSDRYQQRANDIYDALLADGLSLLTTNLVVAETCNWLLRERAAGHQAGMLFGEFIRDDWLSISPDEANLDLASESRLVVYSTPRVEQAAWDIIAKYDTAGFSFTDCVSFAVMQALGIKTAFAFDSHFDMLGFERL